MKKNILFAAMLALAAPVLTSCSDEESEGKSRITTYPILEMVGDDFVKLNVGDSFNDPGCVATLGAEDITDQIMTSTNLDTSTPGFYSVVYKVVNADGFPATASRDIMVVDPNNFASAYLGESQYGTRHYYNAPINITKRADGTYLIDDLGGGMYFWGRYPGYEPSYDFHLEAVLQLNADNTIDVLAQGSWQWGVGAEENFTIDSATYNPETGTIAFVMYFGSETPYYVTLTK